MKYKYFVSYAYKADNNSGNGQINIQSKYRIYNMERVEETANYIKTILEKEYDFKNCIVILHNFQRYERKNFRVYFDELIEYLNVERAIFKETKDDIKAAFDEIMKDK